MERRRYFTLEERNKMIKENNKRIKIELVKENVYLKDLIMQQKEVLDKIKEKGVMYYDREYSKIYGELCSMPGANNTRTPVIVIDDKILELLEEIE